MMDPACALTEFYRSHAARSIADNAREMDATLMLGDCCFIYSRFRGIVVQERDSQLSHLRYMVPVVSFLLLSVTISCKLMNMSKAIRQLSHGLAFNLNNL